MKQSIRTKRQTRHHKRRKANKLNLVSLMDIFTILVFFLMVNSSDVQVLESGDSIELPKSNAKSEPKDTLVIHVNNQFLLVQGRKIADVNAVLAQTDNKIAALEAELTHQASRQPKLTSKQKVLGRAVTIMGDSEISYKLLKRIMATCSSSDYRDISLAVKREVGASASNSVEGA